MSAEVTRNRATARRLDDWLFEVRHQRRLHQVLRAAEIRGRRIDAAPDAQLDADRVSMAGAVVPARKVASPPAARTTCMSFEGCGGLGYRPQDVEGGFRIEVYCWCAAGERLRIADGAGPREESRPAHKGYANAAGSTGGGAQVAPPVDPPSSDSGDAP